MTAIPVYQSVGETPETISVGRYEWLRLFVSGNGSLNDRLAEALLHDVARAAGECDNEIKGQRYALTRDIPSVFLSGAFSTLPALIVGSGGIMAGITEVRTYLEALAEDLREPSVR